MKKYLVEWGSTEVSYDRYGYYCEDEKGMYEWAEMCNRGSFMDEYEEFDTLEEAKDFFNGLYIYNAVYPSNKRIEIRYAELEQCDYDEEYEDYDNYEVLEIKAEPFFNKECTDIQCIVEKVTDMLIESEDSKGRELTEIELSTMANDYSVAQLDELPYIVSDLAQKFVYDMIIDEYKRVS